MIPRIVNQTEATSGPNQTQLAGNRNKIINGAMMIDQRNAGAAVTPANGDYTLDRWQWICSQTSKATVQQNAGSVTPPVGYVKYLGVTSLSAYTVGASEKFTIRQCIEGFNISDLAWGTANAKSITLSFWVYSSLTGTFGGSLYNYDANYYYPFGYTISSANTWTQVSITIAGPTSGTWYTTNTGGIEVGFSLGSGSTVSGTAGSWGSTGYFSVTGATSVVGTSGATFYITGVQLEKGATATPFENRLYGTELGLCQRYGQVWGPQIVGRSYSSTLLEVFPPLNPEMRAVPTFTLGGVPNLTTSLVQTGVSSVTVSSIGYQASTTARQGYLQLNTSGATAGSVLSAQGGSSACNLGFASAEL